MVLALTLAARSCTFICAFRLAKKQGLRAAIEVCFSVERLCFARDDWGLELVIARTCVDE